MLEALFLLLVGLSLLILGSNFLVTSTESFSKYFSISGFIASFFLIGIATSAPEIFISVEAALQNETILAIGNTIGSNISNIALVFCISIFFLDKSNKSMTLSTKTYLGSYSLIAAAFFLMYFDKFFDSIDSLILFLIFITILFTLDKVEDGTQKQNLDNKSKTTLLKIITYASTGLIMLVYGSDLFIDGASQIALLFGISSYVIGLTLTALGTSLPELSASIQSARKGRADFIIGNIIGSNVFNIGIALSIAGLLSPTLVNTDLLLRDILVLIVAMFIFYVIIKSDNFFIKTVYSALLVITYFVYIIVILR